MAKVEREMDEPGGLEQLTPRQREVLELVVKGFTNEEIGSALAISPLTVRTHVSAVLASLGVDNRTEAASLYAAVQSRPERVAEVLARPAIWVQSLRPLSEDARAKTVAAGLTYDLLTLLSRWTWFPVVNAAQPVQGANGESRPPDVRFVVEGALRLQRKTWRLSVRVEDAPAQRTIWAEQYDFPENALFETTDAIVEQVVASAYEVMLAHTSQPSPRAPRVEDLSAWELAHAGLMRQRSRERGVNEEAQRLFTAALEREPTLVIAHFGLGICHYNAALNQWGRVEIEADALRTCAQRCLELAPHAAEGYFLLGRERQTQGDPPSAIRSLEEAIGRNPSFAPGHALLGQLLLAVGRSAEGMKRMQHATRLAPGAYVAGLAAAHFLGGENAEALAAAERALALAPGYTFARLLAIASAWWLGDAARAAQHRQELRRQQPSFAPSLFLKTFGPDQAARIHRALVDES
jgi:TolB-like protein